MNYQENFSFQDPFPGKEQVNGYFKDAGGKDA